MSLNFFKVKTIDYEKLEKCKLSIVLTTFRKDPKFNVIYESLSHQTMKNFELVISDYLYEEHKELVNQLSKMYHIPTAHIKRDSVENVRGLNLGIVNSNGDYMAHINDCTYYPFRWVEKHLLICTNNLMSLGTRYFTYSMDFPIEKYLMGQINLPEKKDAFVIEYIEKASHGIKDYLNINFGEHQVTSPQDFRLLGLPENLLVEDNLILEAMPGWTYGGNIAAPTELYLSINGFNEEYDKGYGWADCDFGIRASNKGYKSYINLSNWVLEIQDKCHDASPDAKDKSNSDKNWKLYEETCYLNKTWVNDTINLRELRKEILEGKQK